jgi:hypothetical protein
MLSNPWKLAVIVLLVLFVCFEGYQGYRWKQVTNERGWRADQAFEYLTLTVPNTKMSRSQILDAIIQQAVQQAAAQQAKAKP